ncbi:hypothetical protein TURU_101895 [Turdus rufiventris]|nr:hypothetical protein TURU_101895 [Turdus rufiventris]
MMSVIDHIQHGYMRGKSYLTNLISLYGKVTHLPAQGKRVDVIFLDFSKAFHTVSHRICLYKISSLQLDKYIMGWVSDWLMGQAQRITANGVTSDWRPVTSGVLQGSILGTVINIFTNDLNAGLKGILNKFANYCKLGEIIESLKGMDALQRDLHKLESWATTNHMSKDKCHILHLG